MLPAKLLALCLAALLAACAKPAEPIAPETEAPAAVAAPAPASTPLASPAGPAAAFALPSRFNALGTEPFWGAKIDGDRLTYSTPENPDGQAVAAHRSDHADRTDLAATLAGQRLTLTVSAGPCSDGMSDTVYPFSVVRRLGEDEQRGCARPTDPG